MKRIVRLTESDLARIVKRVISEQGTATGGDMVFTNIKQLIATANITNWWNKSKILNELKKLNNCQDFTSFMVRVKKRGYDSGIDWIEDTLKTVGYNNAGYVKNPVSDLKLGITDEEFNESVDNILRSLETKCKTK